MKVTSAIGGLAGACTLTALNETIKKLDGHAPHPDLLSMNAVAKIVKGTGLKTETNGKLMQVSMAGDLMSNTLYFAMAEGHSKKNTMIRGALLGLGAGLGAISLAKPLGLDERITSTSATTKMLTATWYVLSGLIAATVINLLDKHR